MYTKAEVALNWGSGSLSLVLSSPNVWLHGQPRLATITTPSMTLIGLFKLCIAFHILLEILVHLVKYISLNWVYQGANSLLPSISLSHKPHPQGTHVLSSSFVLLKLDVSHGFLKTNLWVIILTFHPEQSLIRVKRRKNTVWSPTRCFISMITYYPELWNIIIPI